MQSPLIMTADMLKAVMPNVSEKWVGEYADAINAMAKRFDMATPERLAAVLSICAYESGELNYWSEIGGASMWYAPYYGRGPIQLTHQANYENAGDALDLDLVSNPNLVAKDSYVGFNTVGWFWRNANGDLNTFADDGDLWDCYLRVAGADNGTFPQRKAYYDKMLATFSGAVDAPDDPIAPDEWPQQEMGVSSDGWAYVKSNDGGRLWLRGAVGDEFKTDTEGWVKRTGVNPIVVPAPPPPKTDWEWPVANAAPNPNSWWYTERCPTRYSWAEGGRTDVEAWARYLIDKYPGEVWVNTYHLHPEEVWLNEGVSREYDSMDIWGYGGRGYAIDTDLGNRIFSEVFNDPNDPWIDWIIWQATIYDEGNNWYGEGFGEDDFSWHYDHIHVTYL